MERSAWCISQTISCLAKVLKTLLTCSLDTLQWADVCEVQKCLWCCVDWSDVYGSNKTLTRSVHQGGVWVHEPHSSVPPVTQNPGSWRPITPTHARLLCGSRVQWPWQWSLGNSQLTFVLTSWISLLKMTCTQYSRWLLKYVFFFNHINLWCACTPVCFHRIATHDMITLKIVFKEKIVQFFFV